MAAPLSRSAFGGPVRIAALLALYGVGFTVAYHFARPWGGAHFFSLWYPAAGVRVALLWHCGARWAPVITLYECLIQLGSGVVDWHHPDVWNHLGGVARAPLAYGATIGLVQWMQRRGTSELAVAPMPFGLAAVLAPTAAAFVAGLWEWAHPGVAPDLSTQPFATTIAAFLVGDLLGVLLVAPPLLWLAARFDGGDDHDGDGNGGAQWPSHARMGESALVLGIGWTLAMALASVDPQISLTPVLVAATWVGLRCGRHGAWAAIMACAAIILPWSAPMTSVATRFALHMGLAGVAISAYLAGSFADAQARARRDIARRDRILFQAERLRTLRAMSVAVIHEISQPLSTLAIESRHLDSISRADHPNIADMAQSAALIARKADTLADMVRRLRRFGGRAVDEPSPLSLRKLVEDAIGIVAGEARGLRCRVVLAPSLGDPMVRGQEVELTQALLNLIRNAMTASPGGTIAIAITTDDAGACVRVSNATAAPPTDHAGMGVGTLVARAIVEAHGGQLIRARAGEDDGPPDAMIHHLIRLPVMEAAHE